MLRHWIPFPSPNCTATGGNQRSISIASALFALFLGVGPVLAASEVVGITEPFYDVTMNSPVTGIIGARLVEEGEFVRRGQLLIELDKKLEELDLSRKERVASVSVCKAKIAKISVAARPKSPGRTEVGWFSG